MLRHAAVLLLILAAACDSSEPLAARSTKIHVDNEAAGRRLSNRFSFRAQARTAAPAASEARLYVLGAGAAKGALQLSGDGVATDEQGDAVIKQTGPALVAVDVNADKVPDAVIASVAPGRARSISVGEAVTSAAGSWLSVSADRQNYTGGDTMTLTLTGYLAAPAPVVVEIWNKWHGGFRYFVSGAQDAPAGPLRLELSVLIDAEWPATNEKTGADYVAVPWLGAQVFGGENFNILEHGQKAPAAPQNPAVVINGGAAATESADVMLDLHAAGAAYVQLANDEAGLAEAPWLDMRAQTGWALTPGVGEKTVYARFAGKLGAIGTVASDTIQLTAPGGEPVAGDAVAPAIQAVTPAPGTVLTTAAPALQVAVSETAACRWSLASEPYSSMAACGAAGTSVACNVTGLAQGMAAVWLQCRDAAGNLSAALPAGYWVDTQPPGLMDPSLQGKTVTFSDPSLTAYLSEPGDCRWSSAAVDFALMGGACSGAGTTRTACTLAGMAEGANTVYVACRDAAGNASGVGSLTQVDFTVDTHAPVVGSITPPSGTKLHQSQVPVTLALDEPATCRWDSTPAAYGSLARACLGAGSSSALCGVENLREGSNTIYFGCSDTAGNVHQFWELASVSYSVDTSAPVILSGTPASGMSQARSGASLTLDISEPAACRWGTTNDGFDALAQVCAGGGSATAWCDLASLGAGSRVLYIACRDAAGNTSAGTPWSVALMTAPAAPSGLAATSDLTARVTLTWLDNAADETGYVLERHGPAGTFAAFATAPAGTMRWVDDTRTPATAFTYRVKAVGAYGDSAYSNEAAANTPAFTTPAAPWALAGTPENRAVRLTWGAVTGATAYRVYYGGAAATYTGTQSNEGVSPVTVTSPAAKITGLTNGVPQYFAVKAVGPSGLTSAYSNEVRLVPNALVAEGVSMFDATVHNLVRDRAGNLYAAVHMKRTGSQRRVEVRRSTDGGATWSALFGVADFYDAYYPSIAIDGKDRVHLVYEAKLDSSSTWQVFYQQWSGTSWSLAQYIGFEPTYNQNYPMVLADVGGRIHILWSGATVAGGGASQLLYASCLTNCDVGGSWGGSVAPFSAAGEYFYVFDAALDSQDRLHVVAHTTDASVNYRIRYSNCSGDCESTSNWLNSYVVYNGTVYEQYAPKVIVDGYDAVHVFWNGTDAASGFYQLRTSKCSWPCGSPAAWSAPYKPAALANYNQYGARVAMGDKGALHLFWSGPVPGNTNNQVQHAVCTSPCTAAAWSAREQLTNGNTATSYGAQSILGVRGARRHEGGGSVDYLWMNFRSSSDDSLASYGVLSSGFAVPRAQMAVARSVPNYQFVESGRRLVRTSTGKLVAAFQNAVSASTDEGRTWSPVAAGTPSIIKRPALAVDGNDVVHMVYDNGASQEVYAALTTAGAWSAPVVLDTASIEANLVVGADNRLHVLLAGGKYRTCAAACSTLANWSTVITPGPAASWLTSTMDGAGVLHAAWVAGSYTEYSRCASNCSVLGNWSARIMPANTGGNGQATPSLAVDAAGRVKLAFLTAEITGGSMVRYTSCSAACTTAASWAPAVTVSTGAPAAGMGQYSVQIGVTAGGTTFISYMGQNTATYPHLRLVYCHEACGAGDWKTSAIFYDGSRGYYPSMRWSKNFMNGGSLDFVLVAWNGAYADTYISDPLVNMGAAPASQPAPAAPSGLVATKLGTQSIRVSWTDNASNEEFIKLERKTGSAGAWGPVVTLPANTITYDDTGLAEGVTYYYRAKAGHSTAESAYSNEGFATTDALCPAAPAQLSVGSPSVSTLQLTWTDASYNESGFRVDRRTGSGGYSTVANLAAGTVSWQDSGLAGGTTYIYKVYAWNAGCATGSSEASGTTTVPPPNAPINPAASSAGGSALQITWTDMSNNETEFRIVRSTQGGSYVLVGTVSANTTSFLDTGLTANQQYTYKVGAFSSAGWNYSTTASGTPIPDNDGDRDGYNSVASGGSDCNDLDAAVHPGAVDGADGVDTDCDGSYDEDGLLTLLRYYKNWSASQNVDWEHRFSTEGNNPYAPIASSLDGHAVKIYPLSFGSSATVTRGAVTATRLHQCTRTALASDGLSNHWTMVETEGSTGYIVATTSGQWSCAAIGYVITTKAVSDVVHGVEIHRFQSGNDYTAPGEPNPPVSPWVNSIHTSTMYSNVVGDGSQYNFVDMGVAWYAMGGW